MIIMDIPQLPPVPEITIEQHARYEYITDEDTPRQEVVNREIDREYRELTFLIQTHLFIRLATDEFVNFADENYVRQAWRNYYAYLENK